MFVCILLCVYLCFFVCKVCFVSCFSPPTLFPPQKNKTNATNPTQRQPPSWSRPRATSATRWRSLSRKQASGQVHVPPGWVHALCLSVPVVLFSFVCLCLFVLHDCFYVCVPTCYINLEPNWRVAVELPAIAVARSSSCSRGTSGHGAPDRCAPIAATAYPSTASCQRNTYLRSKCIMYINV